MSSSRFLRLGILAAAMLSVVALFLPWFGMNGLDDGSESGVYLLGALVGVTLVVAGVFTSLMPKRRRVASRLTPQRLGLAVSALGVLVLVLRALEKPGPSSAASFVEHRPGIWLALLSAAIAVAGLAAHAGNTSPFAAGARSGERAQSATTE